MRYGISPIGDDSCALVPGCRSSRRSSAFSLALSLYAPPSPEEEAELAQKVAQATSAWEMEEIIRKAQEKRMAAVVRGEL